jgi:hypothetical protein
MSQSLTDLRAHVEGKPHLGAATHGPGARTWNFARGLSLVAILGLAFQIGHFAEHVFQFVVWVLGDFSNICGRDTPWMSPWVTRLVQRFGLLMFPARDAAAQMMLGMELLHLIANCIFLTSLVCLYCWIPSKWVRWAVYIETFHLCEHVSLTATAYFLGKPVGMSTLLGRASLIGEREFAVGFRVTWHFVMNLLPMPFAMIALMEHYEQGLLRHR